MNLKIISYIEFKNNENIKSCQQMNIESKNPIKIFLFILFLNKINLFFKIYE